MNYELRNQSLLVLTFLFLILPVLKAQDNDSIGKPQSKTLKALGIAIPSAMITYGIFSIENNRLKELDLSVRNKLVNDGALWNNKWDDYLQFAPSVFAFSMKLGGVESKHKLSDMLILYGLSEFFNTGIVYTAKRLVGRERPDGSNFHSFPSGHTALAFTAAEFLHQEYGHKSVWISIGGYGIASFIGLARVYRNKHWVSDVIAGAGVGILSTKIVYLAYPALKRTFGKCRTAVFPAYNNGNLSLNLSGLF